jgi:hypothetical protein
MALIDCPECGKEISDKAPHCIHCGYRQESPTAEATTIEATGKSWKAMQAIGAVGGAVSLSLAYSSDVGSGFQILFSFIGACCCFLYLYGRMMAWWENG